MKQISSCWTELNSVCCNLVRTDDVQPVLHFPYTIRVSILVPVPDGNLCNNAKRPCLIRPYILLFQPSSTSRGDNYSSGYRVSGYVQHIIIEIWLVGNGGVTL